MYKAHRVLAFLMLQGCSLLTDFDRFGHGRADAGATVDAGNWAQETPDASPQDAGENVDGSPRDSGLLPDASPQDAGENADAGHALQDAGPQDAGELPPLGPHTTDELHCTTNRTYESCGHASLFVSQWPRESTTDLACPDVLLQTGTLVLASDFGCGIADSNCQWAGDPTTQGATFTLDGAPVETVLAYWRSGNPYRMTAIWRGLLCVYRATPIP